GNPQRFLHPRRPRNGAHRRSSAFRVRAEGGEFVALFGSPQKAPIVRALGHSTANHHIYNDYNGTRRALSRKSARKLGRPSVFRAFDTPAARRLSRGRVVVFTTPWCLFF